MMANRLYGVGLGIARIQTLKISKAGGRAMVKL